MQGRLSPIRNSRIQSFPWDSWEKEFEQAQKIGFSVMEWTIDSENFSENPLITKNGLNKIKKLTQQFDIGIPSVTCDYFMENPSWKSDENAIRENLTKILDGMTIVGARTLVIPLVDNSAIKSQNDLESAKSFFQILADHLTSNNLQIAFESDFAPRSISEFLLDLSPKVFGINYDTGNSASLGFDPAEELLIYGTRILNVHVKDRILGGSTVPLGEGSADFKTVFGTLAGIKYSGNFILQTARSSIGDHVGVIEKYRDMTVEWMDRYGL